MLPNFYNSYINVFRTNLMEDASFRQLLIKESKQKHLLQTQLPVNHIPGTFYPEFQMSLGIIFLNAPYDSDIGKRQARAIIDERGIGEHILGPVHYEPSGFSSTDEEDFA